MVPGEEGEADRPQPSAATAIHSGVAAGQTVVSVARWQARERTAETRQKPVTTSVGTAAKRRESTE